MGAASRSPSGARLLESVPDRVSDHSTDSHPDVRHDHRRPPRAGGRRCSPPFSVRSGRLTCARSCCSQSRSSRSTGWVPRCPARASPTATCRSASTSMQQSDASGVFTLLNLFSGGALLQLSVFALGIMPYITASIILQLLTVVIPRLEQLRKEGQAGQAKITQYTRYLTLGLGDPAGLGVRRAGPLRPAVQQPVRPSSRSSPTTPGCRIWLTLAIAGHHDDRRHRRGHVAGRADHRPRRRQRHVGPDLHLDRGPPPQRGLADQGAAAAGASSSW